MPSVRPSVSKSFEESLESPGIIERIEESITESRNQLESLESLRILLVIAGIQEILMESRESQAESRNRL